MQDSYDLMVNSIIRHVRRDVGEAVASALPGAVDRVMLEEARGGERRLADLRVLVIASFAVLVLAAPRGAATPAVALLLGTWLAGSIALAIALRRGWFRRWVPRVMPWVDAVAVATAFIAPLELEDAPVVGPGTFAGFVVVCAFLCLAGGMRLSRTANQVGIVLALLVFLIGAARADIGAAATIGVLAALAGVGLLSAGQAAMIRRFVTDEVAKLVLAENFREARHEVEARDQVLKVVVHDLRNPLNTIRMGSDVLLESAVPEHRRAEVLQRIRRAETWMERLVRDLMDVSKLERGRLAMDFRTVEPEVLLREIHADLSPAVVEQGLSCELDVASDLPQIEADAGRLQQVIANLVGNAVKFTAPGGRITIAARPAPAGVRFTVQDTGKGMAPEQVANLFRRFWQADMTDRRGLGLGLSIAKLIVEAHAGQIWCESTVGAGTAFHFAIGVRLPAVAPAAPAVSGERVPGAGVGR